MVCITWREKDCKREKKRKDVGSDPLKSRKKRSEFNPINHMLPPHQMETVMHERIEGIEKVETVMHAQIVG